MGCSRLLMGVILVLCSAVEGYSADSKVYFDTRMRVERCIKRPDEEKRSPLALGLAILPKAIDVAVDTAAAALKTAAAKDEQSCPVHTNSFFYEVQGDDIIAADDRKCLIIYSGDFGEPAGADGFSFKDFPGKQAERLRELGMTDDPRFYFEALIEFDPKKYGRNLFRLVPQYLYYREFMKESILSSKRDLVLSIAFNDANKSDASMKTFAATSFTFRDLPERTVLDQKYLQHLVSDWMPVMPEGKIKDITELLTGLKAKKEELQRLGYQAPASEEEQKKLREIDAYIRQLCGMQPDTKKKPDEACLERGFFPDEVTELKWKIEKATAELNAIRSKESLKEQISALREKADLLKPFGYYTIDATIVETRRANKFLAFLAEIADRSKDDIRKELKAEWVPAEREKAAETERSRQDDAAIAILKADKDVAEKQESLDKLKPTASKSERIKAENDLKIAKINANAAYRNAGKAEPYPVN
ncbi:MAG: hypothetical protein ACYC69_17185 [Thermodesulfovibrionales bacterium]